MSALEQVRALTGDGSPQECQLTVGALTEDLQTMLRLIAMATGRFIVIVDVPGGRYVQFMGSEAGSLIAECSSNEFLEGPERLSDEAEELLPELGWDWPAPPNQPNWVKVEHDEAGALDLAVLAAHTLRRVLGCAQSDLVELSAYRSTAVP
jgi:hypothetical protein